MQVVIRPYRAFKDNAYETISLITLVLMSGLYTPTSTLSAPQIDDNIRSITSFVWIDMVGTHSLTPIDDDTNVGLTLFSVCFGILALASSLRLVRDGFVLCRRPRKGVSRKKNLVVRNTHLDMITAPLLVTDEDNQLHRL